MQTLSSLRRLSRPHFLPQQTYHSLFWFSQKWAVLKYQRFLLRTKRVTKLIWGKQTRPLWHLHCTGMWLLGGHRIVRDQVWCYQHFQILLPFVRPLLYSECSIITIIDIGIELYFHFLFVSAHVTRQVQSSQIQKRHCSFGPNVPQSLSSHICVPNSEIDLVKKVKHIFRCLALWALIVLSR